MKVILQILTLRRWAGYTLGFATHWLAMAMSIEESEKEVWINNINANTSHLVKKIVKIGSVDPEITWLTLKNKKLEVSGKA